jgi:hypothetical protein
VEREAFDDLAAALDALEQRARDAGRERRPAVKAGVREYAPVEQVQARLELRGPRGMRAGVDVRGNGKAEAFTGRVRRRLVEPERGESVYGALRRVLTSSTSVDP